ncbi:hypothetical protein CAF53_18090 [Sphingobium sp. LB126]|nr:hypothetical protein CAF53_18090 [Sphingobium sp. LB126]
MRGCSRTFHGMLLGCSVLAGVPAAAMAQQPGAADARPANDDIVVTARRREERLQDVPVAVTALGAAAIERQGVVSVQDIRRIAPSTNVSQSAGGGRQIPLFTIRGQRQGDTLASVDPSVGIYIGDQLFKRTFGVDQVAFDLASVEVLKGAQGTLFGLNVTGGNIIFRPALPTDDFGASVMVGIGNFDDRKIEGYVNIPLGEGAALRVAGRYEKRDGYIRVTRRDGADMPRPEFKDGQQTYSPGGRREDAQDLDGGAFRISLKLNPTDNLESVFSGNYMRSGTNGSGFRMTEFVSPSTLTALQTLPVVQAAYDDSQALGFYEARSNVRSYAKTSPAWNITNTTSYHISDAVTLKNIIGYRRYKTKNFENIDGSDLRYMEYGTNQNGREFSEEFQIVGTTDELDWIVGAYYMQEKVRAFSNSISLLAPSFDAFQTPYNVFENVKNRTKSVFGSATQKLDNITGGLSLTLGGRYTWDTRQAEYGTIYLIGQPGQYCGFGADVAAAPGNPYDFDPATCLVNRKKTFSKFTYTATLDWKVSQDLLVYFSNRKGYRAGGWGTRAQSAAQLVPFNPDTVVDFELGAKYNHRFGNGGSVTVNAALYRSNYSDIQRLVPYQDPVTKLVFTNVVNAANARIQGFELETTLRPNRFIELSGFLSHTDPKYKRFDIFDSATGTTQNVAAVADFSGVSRWQYGLTGRLSSELGSIAEEGAVQLTWYHQSKFNIQDRPYRSLYGVTPGYGLLNGRVELNKISGQNINAAFFVNNLLDRKYEVANYSLEREIGFSSRLVGAPRMYGLEVRFTY